MTENLEATKSPTTESPNEDTHAGNHESPTGGGLSDAAHSPRMVVPSERTVPEDGPTLFVRMDRLGDLTLSLPADGLYPEADGERNVDWWISEGLGFVADHAVPRRRVREMKSKVTQAKFKRLLRELKDRKYKTAVVFHAPWWVSPLLWLAGIPNRVGVRSQWHSFLFFNKGVRQKRSLAETSEFEYNMRVIDSMRSESEKIERQPLKLSVDPEWQAITLKKHALTHRKYSVIHPGMAGSARNWPTSHYISWLQEASKDAKIVVTGTATDEVILQPIRQALQGTQNIEWLDSKLTGAQLLHVLEGASCVLAPSTGVAHLAASLGRPVIGIYSPVKVQHPTRWAPQGEAVQILVPDVECPGKKACVGSTCPQFDCMNRISLESVRSLWSALH